mmetsp:Transcript_9528/g.14560  ORF Transcript_9528/g.14560 Transcript_9528/m.14560 type:complete len:111 (+) Transcript_9528:247-579(+)
MVFSGAQYFQIILEYDYHGMIMATQCRTRSSLSHPLESIIHSSFESILTILILLCFNAVESSSKEEENDRKDSATNNRMKENDVYYSQNICSIFGREKNGSGHWTYVRQV